MPPSKDKLEKKRGGEPIRIAQSRLLRKLLETKEGVETEHEIERRYLPAKELTEEELLELSGGIFDDIEQVYVAALDRDGDSEDVRLRRTEDVSEEVMLHVVWKEKVKGKTGKIEHPLEFSEDDPDAKEFKTLWKRHWGTALNKRRFYIDHTLPNGNVCHIHYDVGKGVAFEGKVRIEIEFDTPEDEKYVADRTKGGIVRKGILPDWIGNDVTDDKRYNSKWLAEHGRWPDEEKKK